ncbi:MAG TPA: hypothetical protein PK801_01605 [Aggregatilineales bacterium]|nr:hypothetical protein [Chloroflexota bacterium]HOA25374.1 hypothetical protein [Aggregatilineales bacterium]HPV07381.1 hypothetical protein [Aggregatilineales bacterium]HQA66988.1 hypothetical protein [Aggregatilineales bacterium]HQE18654.1 hypothetical protein [Aggregatilineales bacterium]
MNRITTNKSQSRLPILIAVLVAVVLVAGLLIAMLTGVIGGGGERRNTGSTPRYIDIWAVYPDGSIRFAVRFHPGESAGGIVDVAGPLVLSDEQVISAEVIGDDELVELAYLPGPGQDSAFVYPQFRLAREAGDDSVYGADVLVRSTPYISVDPVNPALRALSLGTVPQTYYKQVVVAVAFPTGTRIQQIPELQPYRRTKVGGWDVYYFDTTHATAGDSIRLVYTPPSGANPPDLDIARIDAQR